MAAPSADYGFDATLAPPAAAPSTQALGQPTVIGDSPQDADSAPIAPPVAPADADSAPIAPPAAPADADSAPIAPPAAPADADSTPIESPIPSLSDAELQAKMKRWGPILSGQSIGAPADFTEMAATGKFTPQQLQWAQGRSDRRTAYIQDQAKGLGAQAWDAAKAAGTAAKNILEDVTVAPRAYQEYQDLYNNGQNPQSLGTMEGRVGGSVLEGGYQAGAGIGSLAGKLLTGIPRAAARAWGIGQPTPDEAFNDYELNYLRSNATPGYAQPDQNGAVQNAAISLAKDLGVPDAKMAALQPIAPITSMASTLASIPAFGAAAKIGEAVIPKVLAATGAAEAAPTLSKLITPTSSVEKLKGAMDDALAKATSTGEAAAPALDTAANKALPVTAATPEQAAAIESANGGKALSPAAPGEVPPVIGNEVSPAAPGRVAQVGTGALPATLDTLSTPVSWTGQKISALAQPFSNFLKWASGKGGAESSEIAPWVKYYLVNHIPIIGHALTGALAVVKAMEATGKVTQGLGDAMEQLAKADPNSPMGMFASAAEQAPAGHWMKKWAQNPAVQIALKGGTLAGGAIKGAIKGAATGAGISLLSGDNAQEAGSNIAGMGLFGTAEGGLSAPQAKILDAQIGGVSKVISDHFANGGSKETLQLVPASDILTAANLKSALPDYSVRFATDLDGTKPPIAQGQAGYYDRANKTLWVDPENRAPGSTMLHEAFHPIFDEMVAQHPEIKSVLDQALSADTSAGPEGKTIDHFKLDYANRVSKGDPYAAAEYIKGQDAANPDWGYSEMLSEAASHALDGKDLLQAMQGKDVQQSATQAALAGVDGWLSDNGVDFQQRQNTGTIFPDFKGSFNNSDLRRMTFRLLKAQRDSVFNSAPIEAPGTPLTSAAMGGAVAPTYNENGRQINQYGEVKDTPTGKKFVPFPASEIRRRMNAEKVALPKYFPEIGKNYTSMPAGLLADPDITPWTKNTLKTMFDAKDAQNKVSFWNQGLSGKKSAVSDVAWARQVARDLGNVEARYQSGRFTGVKRSKANNLVMELDSEEAENQRLGEWAKQHGPVSLDLWGGNQAAAKADIETYKNNLAANQPGETGLSIDKRNVINALLAGDNKEFQASNPLRSLLKKKDRAATFRSFRPERVGAISTEPTDVPAVKWERAKANLSPAAAEEVKEPEKRMIELIGPDGKKYPAKYDGLQENFTGGAPWIQVTPQVDLPGSTGKFSTTYEPSLLKQGYTLPADLKAEVDKYNAANPPKPMKFSPSANPRAVRSAAVRDEETGRVYTGAIHAEALVNYLNDKYPESETRMVIGGAEDYPVTAGFVTNNGKFLDREQAYKRAVELKQYKGKPTVTAYDDEAPSGLEAIRFNRQQPMKSSPSDDPNAIASAAVQDEDTGKIYIGPDHSSAARKAPTGRAGNLIDGYVTNSGKFLDRDTAFKQAVALKQYKPGSEDRNINQELYGLTSERFNKQNPNTYAGMQRAKAALEKEGNFSPASQAETDLKKHLPGTTLYRAVFSEKPDLKNPGVHWTTDYGVARDWSSSAGATYDTTKTREKGAKQILTVTLPQNLDGIVDFKKSAKAQLHIGEGEVQLHPDHGLKATVLETHAFSPAEKVEQTKTPEFKKWFGESKAANDSGKPLTLYRGTAHPQNVFEGGGFFTDSKPDAQAYSDLAAVSHHVDESPELSEIIGDIQSEEGGESLTDLGGEDRVREIAEANGIKLPESVSGHVEPVYLRTENPLDLRDLGGSINNIARAWTKFHAQGLLPEKWTALDSDVQHEMRDNYNGKALYTFLEREGIFTGAVKKGFDSVIFSDNSLNGKSAHDTWWVPNAEQVKSVNNSGGFSRSNPDIRFSPAQPETISRAAVRVDKEHTFESDSHSGAYAKARKAGVITEDDQGGPRTEEGFKTSAGRFVDRAEGYRLASAANQVNTREPALTDNGRWLDSSNVKAYSPAQKETEKLSYHMEMTPGHNTGALPGLLKAPYDVRERYQADMLKAMEPLFAAFGAKPGATTKSSYKNSAGETEHNPMTAVEVPAQDAKLFGLLHGHFARQEAVAGGFQETSPGKWEPVGPHSFYAQATPDSPFADKIKEMGPEAEAMLAKLQLTAGPAVEAVNKKYEQQLGMEKQKYREQLRSMNLTPISELTEADKAEVAEANAAVPVLVPGATFRGKQWLHGVEQAEKTRKPYQFSPADKQVKSHDYDASQDYTLARPRPQTRKALETAKQEVLAELPNRSFQDFKVVPVKNGSLDPSVAKYVDGTSSEPVIVIDVGAHLDEAERTGDQLVDSFKRSILHELHHAEEDAAGEPYNEVKAEQAAKPSEPAPFVPTGVLKHRSNHPAKAAAAVADAKPGQPIALGTFSPPQMSDKAFEKLAGKKMLFVIGDQARAGQDYITASGKSAGALMGGPGYPNMPEIQGKAGWAVNKQHITRLAKAFKNVDYMAVFAGSPDMSLGSISFARAYLAELKDAVESGAVKSGVLNRLAREAGRRVRMGETKSGTPIDIPVIHNFSELEDLVTPTLEGRRGPRATENAKGASFEARSSLFKILGSFTNNKKFGTPLINAIRDKFNETGAFEPGQLMQIVRINREKPIAPAAEHGVPEHPSYTQVIPGTGLGQPPKKLMMADVLKPWAENGPAAKHGGNLDYKVRIHMPQTEINPALFENK